MTTLSTGAGRDGAKTTQPTAARVEIPATEFALAGLFERVPKARVELQPTIASPPDRAVVAVTADEHDRTPVETAIREDPAFAAVEAFGESEGGWTYRVRWDGRARQLLHRAVAETITVTEAWAHHGHWRFRLLAPDRESLSTAYDAVETAGFHPECTHIESVDRNPIDRTPADRSELTEQQREALVEAFKAGYYEIPRGISVEDLAEELDISHQALSERFRRAHQHLVGSVFGLEE